MQENALKRRDGVAAKVVLAWGAAFAFVMLGAVGIVVAHNAPREESEVGGTVQSAQWRLNGDTGQSYPFIQVKLDSGDFVRIGNMAPALPAVGDRVTLRRRAMLFDYMTVYEWDGPSVAISEPALTTPMPTPVSHP